MQNIKFLKLTFTLILLIMVITLIINYYINFFETKSIVTPIKEEINIPEHKYDAAMSRPQYYSYNKNGQKLLIEAKYANKNERSINLDKISGQIEIQKGINLSYKAKHGTIYVDTKEIILDTDIVLLSKDNTAKLFANKLLMDYHRYSFSSNEKVNIVYRNIELVAERFSLDDNKLLKFFGNVKMLIRSK